MTSLAGYRIAFLLALFTLHFFSPLLPVPDQIRTRLALYKQTATRTHREIRTRDPIRAKKQTPLRDRRRRSSHSAMAAAAAPPASPPRSRASDKKAWGEEGVLEGGSEGEAARPRSFDVKTRAKCWQKADVVPSRHPERWRRDPAGNVVCKRFWNCHGCLCYEYDHIVPFSKGGESTVDNCQILQTRVNRLKSNKEWVNEDELRGFSCDIKFTDKELDIIEMAVYGDVIRPGNQCKCRTVAEMLGQVKLKDKLAPCELPRPS